VCLETANKKLRLLENLDSDDSDGDGSTNSSKDKGTSTFHIMQEVAAQQCSGEDKKMSAILYWRRHAKIYPNLSHIVKVYLTLSAFSVAGLVKKS